MKFDIKNLKKWRLFLLFLVIAAALWYIHKLDYNYKTEVSVHVRLTMDHNSVGWIENPEFDIICMVDAKGGDILKHNVKWNHLIEIPASSLSMEHVGGYRYRISQGSFKDAISAAQNKLNIVQMLDTLPQLQIIPLENVVLPIRSRIKIDCRRQYMMVNEVEFTPSAVHVRAPRTMLDTLRAIDTQPLELGDVNKSMASSINLVCPDNVILSQPSVRYSFKVTGYTELEYDLAVEFFNAPEDKSVVAVPSQVKVLVKVPLSNFGKSGGRTPVAMVDYDGFLDGGSKLLRVQVDSIPYGGQITRITPEFIEPLLYGK